jgi:hypothetical protein
MRINRPAYISRQPIFRRLGLIVCLPVWSAAASADIVLATHPENPLRTLEMVDARRIFLKQTNEFPGGNKALVAILDGKSETRRIFESQVLKMSPSQIKTYWAGFIFNGQNHPPREFATEEAMKKWIAATPGALGYLDTNEVDDTIKVLATIAEDSDR